jgi:UDP-N-acetylglucosamine 2-epimerase (non-hydrolysing)
VKLLCVVGARPNFMKVAPVHAALGAAGHDSRLVHTGQHYDARMSDVFFADLGMPQPHLNLEVGSGSHAVQTARIMEAFEPVVERERPRGVLVAGDVNSTIACALVAVKLGVPVAHLEAGLRSFDRAMPEEINRVLTDAISDVLLTPSADADDNLRREGVAAERIARVGNAMIDSLVAHLPRARASGALARAGMAPREYALVTLHRPSNVDDPAALTRMLGALAEVARTLPVLFPVHPRTRARIDGLPVAARDAAAGLRMIDPLGYLDFLALEADARVVVTDSGGVQEETTALGVPCLTVRTSTERPVTVSEGTNLVIGTDPARLVAEVANIVATGGKAGRIPDGWDGHTGPRVVTALTARWA